MALQGESVFMKALLGAGYSSSSETVPTTPEVKLSFSGLGGFMGLQAGGSLTKELKIFGLANIFYGPSPGFKAQNLTVDSKYDSNMILDFGLGAAYYLPNGMYASLAASIATNYFKYTVYEYKITSYTRHGWGLHLNLGKEFAFSKRASYGGSLVVYYGNVFDVGPAPFLNTAITNFYVGLAGSVTYD